MRSLNFPVVVAAGVLALAVAPPARAAFLVNNTGLAAPSQTITFSEVPLPSGVAVTTQYAGFGVTFAPNLYYDPQPGFFPTPSLGNYNLVGGPPNDPASVLFTQNQSAAAFALQTNPGTTTFTALLNGVVVESASASTSAGAGNASNFYGFTGITFNEIRIDPNNTFFQLDNLQTGPAVSAVPVPGGLLLALSGGAFWAAVTTLRRRASLAEPDGVLSRGDF